MFKGAALIKANISTLLKGFALKQYTFKLVEFNYNIFNNNSIIKSRIHMLFQYFKISTSIILNFFTNKIYLHNNAYYF